MRKVLAPLVAAVAVAGPGVSAAEAHNLNRSHMRHVVAPYRYTLERIARCESGGRWHINTGNGFYGGLQFTYRSWHAVGGASYPHYHSKLEQMWRGVRLMRVQGWGAWPVCSRR